jgi:hypothetical protein
MKQKRLFPVLAATVALLLVAAAVSTGWAIFQGDPRLLRNVSNQHELITPNADGDRDATRMAYELTRNATISVYFENDAGERFYFRRDQPRGVGKYQVNFSGVVEGYRLPGEQVQGEILARLLPDGDYTWIITATDQQGVHESAHGRLTIAEADTALPEMRGFELDRSSFTPNQDGIDDRVLIQFDLQKEAQVRVFLLTDEGVEYPIAEKNRDVPPGMPGRHYYDYEGGVDQNAPPPPDGRHTIVAIAEDATGQRLQVTKTLAIAFGGVPRADIVSPASGRALEFSATAVSLCDVVTFTLTVNNYGPTPIRTTGPEPGMVYDSNWNYNTLSWHTESGAWRVGIGFENELSDYPFRWAIGNRDDLQEIDGHYYLMPGRRAVVTGGIRLVGPLGERNPQPIWAGLIHEDVRIDPFNSRVDRQALLVDMPDPENRQPCPDREIPARIPSQETNR